MPGKISLHAAVALAVLAVGAPGALAHSAAHRHRSHRLVVKAHIVGGQPVSGPAVGMLARVTFSGSQSGLMCSGTVISENVVLTAGHCAVDASTGAVNPASGYQVTTATTDIDAEPGQVSAVSRVIPYPAFDRATLSGDAALLQLSTPTSAPPVALATSPADALLVAAGAPAIVAGWGALDSAGNLPDQLQAGAEVVQASPGCAQHAETLGLPFDGSDQLCAVDAPSLQDGPCHGDSGGPLLVAAGGSWVQIGLTSFGDSQCSTASPGYFTRADAIASWAQGWIAALAPPAVSTASPAGPTATTTASPPVRTQTLPATRPDAGVYRGRTGQRRPIRLRIGRSRRTVTQTSFGFALRCAGHRRLRYAIVPGLTWRLNADHGMGFDQRFLDPSGARYRVVGSFSTRGRARGTLSVSWHSPRYGMCTSGGAIHWRAAA